MTTLKRYKHLIAFIATFFVFAGCGAEGIEDELATSQGELKYAGTSTWEDNALDGPWGNLDATRSMGQAEFIHLTNHAQPFDMGAFWLEGGCPDAMMGAYARSHELATERCQKVNGHAMSWAKMKSVHTIENHDGDGYCISYVESSWQCEVSAGHMNLDPMVVYSDIPNSPPPPELPEDLGVDFADDVFFDIPDGMVSDGSENADGKLAYVQGHPEEMVLEQLSEWMDKQDRFYGWGPASHYEGEFAQGAFAYSKENCGEALLEAYGQARDIADGRCEKYSGHPVTWARLKSVYAANTSEDAGVCMAYTGVTWTCAVPELR